MTAAAVAAAGGVIAALVLTWAVIAWPGAQRLLNDVAGMSSTTLSRVQLWRDGLALAGDTPFTGSGLGCTMMVYSTYAMLIHVGFISHAHNLFLQITLQQGLPGLAAFLTLLALGWRTIGRGQSPAGRAGSDGLSWRLAAAAALTALVVHGTVDAGIIVSRLAPVALLPIGFAMGSGRILPAARTRRTTDVLIAGLIALLALAILPGTRAVVLANLGAASQTRAELSVYRWPDWPIQDALRRQAPDAPPPVDLSPAIARYRSALALNPNNVTANRRLGQIELSQGDYEAARGHLETAYASAPWQRATRQLLAEAYAVTGQTQQAAELLNTVDLSQNQLGLRKWWYDVMGIDVEWGR